MNGLSDKTQALITLVATGAFAAGAYVSQTMQNPTAVLIGGAVAAGSLAVKELLGSQPTTQT
jgi:hypothetical protein